MKVSRQFRGDPERELDALVPTIAKGWEREHHTDGTHKVTPNDLHFGLVAGGAAGHVAFDGVAVGDVVKLVLNLTDRTDLTSNWSITAPNRLTSTGASTAGKTLLVVWLDLT